MTPENPFNRVTNDDGLELTYPKASSAGSNSVWNKDNLWLRSQVTKNDQLVSQGFGKFFNLNEGPEELKVTLDDVVRACEKRQAVATVKIDGSLLIRSIYNGKVYFRTRGSLGYDHALNADEVDVLFNEKYPGLFDPILPEISFLFEWVSPRNQIVIKYDQPDITLVGAVDHKMMNYFPYSDLKQFATILGVSLVHGFVLDSKGWAELYRELETNKEIEGYVIRLNNEQTLVKVKSPVYLAKHAFRFQVNVNKIVDMWFFQNNPDFQTMLVNLHNEFDEEISLWCMPLVSALFDSIKKVKAIECHIRKTLEGMKDRTRKDIALYMTSSYGSTLRFALAMSLMDGKNTDKIIKQLILQNMKQVELANKSIWNSEEDDDNV